jgi:hypothetical protein
MKLAINKCYGGFGLSDAVHKKLIELGVPHFKTWEEIPKNNTEPYVVDSGKDDKLFGSYYSNFRDDDKRNHPLLIQAIEAVGIENASSGLAEIRIVEIPDDVQFEIDDYDGIESVHELHRSW